MINLTVKFGLTTTTIVTSVEQFPYNQKLGSVIDVHNIYSEIQWFYLNCI